MRANALLFLSLGHAFDHLFMLLYATVVLGLGAEFDLSYGERLALATPGFVAFGAGALPAGWLGDRWSRRNMLAIFFFGLGGSAILTGLADSPLALSAGLTLIGLFASIYHPVGIAMVVEGRAAVGRALAVNGIFGNMGVASAALVAGHLMDLAGWRAAFILPGVIAVATGLVYVLATRTSADAAQQTPVDRTEGHGKRLLIRVFGVLLVSAFLGGIIFDATTISLPKLLEERLVGLDLSLSRIGTICAAIFATAAFAQYAVGTLIDRYPIKPVFVLLESAKVVVLLAVGFSQGLGSLVLAFLMMVLVFGEIPISDTLVARYSAARWRSRTYAAKSLVALGVSAVAIPLVSTLHDQGGGLASLFYFLGGFSALIGVAALMLPSVGQSAVRPKAA